MANESSGIHSIVGLSTYAMDIGEKNTDGTPVMWIMTTKNEAPWGKTVHFYDNNGGNNAGL